MLWLLCLQLQPRVRATCGPQMASAASWDRIQHQIVLHKGSYARLMSTRRARRGARVHVRHQMQLMDRHLVRPNVLFPLVGPRGSYRHRTVSADQILNIRALSDPSRLAYTCILALDRFPSLSQVRARPSGTSSGAMSRRPSQTYYQCSNRGCPLAVRPSLLVESDEPR